MVQLAADVDASTQLFTTDTEATEFGGYYTVDDEVVRLTGLGPSAAPFRNKVWFVHRGQAGTTAASHSSGTAVEQYYPEAPGGGGEQTVRLLGPYRVNHDDPDIASNPGWPTWPGTLLTDDIPAGALLIAAHCENPEPWDLDADNAALLLYAGSDQDGDNGPWEVSRYLVGANNSTAAPFVATPLIIGNPNGNAQQLQGKPKTYRFGTTGNKVNVLAFQVASATQGYADIYLLIAEPA